MPPRPLVRAFHLLYFTLGLVMLAQSVETVLDATRGHMPPGDRTHAMILGGLEILAALLFMLPRTMRAGATALLVIFAVAFLAHAVRGDVALTLVAYAAAVLFVWVHGVVGGEAGVRELQGTGARG